MPGTNPGQHQELPQAVPGTTPSTRCPKQSQEPPNITNYSKQHQQLPQAIPGATQNGTKDYPEHGQPLHQELPEAEPGTSLSSTKNYHKQ